MILSAKALHRAFDWSVIPELHHFPKNHAKRRLDAALVSGRAADIHNGDDDRPTGQSTSDARNANTAGHSRINRNRPQDCIIYSGTGSTTRM
jgi:hypothetical protein